MKTKISRHLTDVDCISVSFLLDVFCELNEEATKNSQPSTEQILRFGEELGVRDSNLTLSGVRRICKSLEKEFCKVTKLSLEFNQITDGGVISLSQALKSSACKVTTLDLRHNQITDGGVISLSQALQSSACKVTTLDLSDNQITDTGRECLRNMEHQNPDLYLLYFLKQCLAENI